MSFEMRSAKGYKRAECMLVPLRNRRGRRRVERHRARAAAGRSRAGGREQAGGAQRGLDLMVEHARTRHQFGRPIGSFQAVQHTCAAVLVEVEAARSAAYYALRAAAAESGASQSGEGELAVMASLAKAVCSRLTHAAERGHPGLRRDRADLGTSHPALLQAARSSEILLGTPAYHRDVLARHLTL